MKTTLTWKKAAVFGAVFAWLEVISFGGRAEWINLFDFTLVFLLIVCWYFETFIGGALTALCLGACLDAFSPAPVHTPVFVIMFYGAALMRRLFYFQGSAPHISSFVILIFAGETILYFLSGAYTLSGFPALHILARSLLNFSLFLALLFVFQKKDQAVMYKMR